MAAAAKAVPDEVTRWWEPFCSGGGFAVDQGEQEEPEVDVDSGSDFERVVVVAAGKNAGESGDKMVAHARAATEGTSGGLDRHREEEEVPRDCYVWLQGGPLLGRERKAVVTHAEPRTTGTEIQDKKEEEVSGDCYVQFQDGLLGRKRKIVAHAEPQTTGTEIQDEQEHEEYIAEDSYAQIGGGLLQVRKTQAITTPSKLQLTSETEIHDKKCSAYNKDNQVAAEEENVCVATSESGSTMKAAAQAPVEEPSSSGAADRHCDEKVSEDLYVQLQGGLLGRKRKAIAAHAESETTGTETQDEKGEHDNDATTGVGLQARKRKATVTHGKVQTTTGHNKCAQGECLRAENEMLRLQLVRKTKELEAEQIRRLKLELDLKNKEIDSLEKQNKELRAKNECYKKTAL